MFNYTPFYRSSIGFDRLFRLLDEAGPSSPDLSALQHRTRRRDEYRITMAVAGFGADDLNLEVKQDTLTVSGRKAEKPDSKVQYLHQGIAQRAFERRFELADFVVVEGAEVATACSMSSSSGTSPKR